MIQMNLSNLFFFSGTATTEIYTLSLHDALPISSRQPLSMVREWPRFDISTDSVTSLLRSEEHTSELQSPYDLVCRLLLEKKKSMKNIRRRITIPLNLSNLKLLRRITITQNILHRNLRLLRVRDRKSGSAGMPRPISYAVFCLKKKKKKTQKENHVKKIYT